MTKLQTLADELLREKGIGEDADRKERQAALDEITPQVMQKITPEEVVEHNKQVYTETAEDYAVNPHTQGIIDELVVFMNSLPDAPRTRVLDVGCGPGRDALYMAIPDREYRKSQMSREKDGKTTLERGVEPPSVFFDVLGIDVSEAMVQQANAQKQKVIEEGLLSKKEAYNRLAFMVEDMHNTDWNPHIRFDGVWSCTALFTHTPAKFNKQALENVSSLLKPGGLFFVSYTNGDATGSYDKLKLSSSGHIKYFSQPSPDSIGQLARSYGLKEIFRVFDDMIVNGEVLKKDLFVSQYFKKV